MHFPFPGASQSMLASAMREATELGLIRAVGVCNYNASQMEAIHSELASAGIPLASNQVMSPLLVGWHPCDDPPGTPIGDFATHFSLFTAPSAL